MASNKGTGSSKASRSSKAYRATVNIEYPTRDGGYVYVAAGEIASEIPTSTLRAWIEQGILEEQ